MKKKGLPGYAAVLCLAMTLGLFWTTSLYGQSYDEMYEGHESDYHLSNSYSVIDTSYALNYEQSEGDYLSYLYPVVQVHIEDEILVDLSGIYLQGDIVIAPIYPDFDIIVTNVQGEGNIVIASEYYGRVLFNNVDIIGGIVITNADRFVNVTLNNSNIGFVAFYGLGRVNALEPMQGAAPPNVVINMPGVYLVGNFGRVQSNVYNGLIFLNGNIAGFYTDGNVILVGSGSMGYTAAPAGTLVEIFNPTSSTQGLAEEIVGLVDGLFIYHLARLELNLLESIWLMLANLRPSNITIIPPPLQLPQIQERPQQQPSPPPLAPPILTPPPSPSPDPGLISALNFNIIPPSISLPYNVQRSIVGDGFSGEIEWFVYLNGSRARLEDGNTFLPGVRYVAEITLTPASGRRFPSNIPSYINGLLDAGIRMAEGSEAVDFQRTNRHLDGFMYTRIFISLDFGEGRQQADAFTLGQIEGPFRHVRVYTHYLGQLFPHNFNVRFGVSNNITVTGVSTFNRADGYYLITLASSQQPDGYHQPDGFRPLQVDMRDPLDYHYPYPGTASITPTVATPSLDGVSSAPVGGRVNVRNFPRSHEGYSIFISSVPLFDVDLIVWKTAGFEASQVEALSLDTANQSFYVPLFAMFHEGQNHVYLVNITTRNIIPVGPLYVLPDVGGAGFSEIGFIDFGAFNVGHNIVNDAGHNIAANPIDPPQEVNLTGEYPDEVYLEGESLIEEHPDEEHIDTRCLQGRAQLAPEGSCS